MYIKSKDTFISLHVTCYSAWFVKCTSNHLLNANFNKTFILVNSYFGTCEKITERDG